MTITVKVQIHYGKDVVFEFENIGLSEKDDLDAIFRRFALLGKQRLANEMAKKG